MMETQFPDLVDMNDLERELVVSIVTSDRNTLDVNYENENGSTLLHFAATHGMVYLTNTLIEEKAALNKKDILGYTPILLSARFGHLTILKLLVWAGADLNRVNKYGANVVMMAAASGSLELLSFLVKECHFKCNKSEFNSALRTACLYGRTEIVEYLLKKYPQSLNSADPLSGITPLMMSVVGNNLETARVLMEKSPNRTILNSCSHTALDMAVHMKNEKMVALIKSHEHCSTPLFEETHFFFDERSPCSFSSSEVFQTPKKSTKKKAHPLTPHVFASPKKGKAGRKSSFQLLSFDFLKKRRTRSLESASHQSEKETTKETVLEYVLKAENAFEFWKIFNEHEISFRTFLTLSAEDLATIGINKGNDQVKLLNIIKHYRRIF